MDSEARVAPVEPRRILYVGASDGTCAHRAAALRRLGNTVTHLGMDPPQSRIAFQAFRVGNRLRCPPDLTAVNRRIEKSLRDSRFDLLWIDNGVVVRPRTLRRIRRRYPELWIISYSPDDLFSPHLRSRHYRACAPLYDLHVTTKSYNVPELREIGARDVLFVDNAFEPELHYPRELTEEEAHRLGARVGFIGTYEKERGDWLYALARDGLPVTVHGSHWHGCPHRHPNLHVRGYGVMEEAYAKAISATEINLGFLRKCARDLQTTRSVEIPACGGFLLAERTEEHRRLFEEGVEAVFFSSYDELLEKCRYYLDHGEERRRIAERGRRRCLESGYRNDDRMAKVLAHLERRSAAARQVASSRS